MRSMEKTKWAWLEWGNDKPSMKQQFRWALNARLEAELFLWGKRKLSVQQKSELFDIQRLYLMVL